MRITISTTASAEAGRDEDRLPGSSPRSAEEHAGRHGHPHDRRGGQDQIGDAERLPGGGVHASGRVPGKEAGDEQAEAADGPDQLARPQTTVQ